MLNIQSTVILLNTLYNTVVITQALHGLIRKFTNEAVIELERFYSQKVSDFRSILINFVQLQMHINKKVIYNMIILS